MYFDMYNILNTYVTNYNTLKNLDFSHGVHTLHMQRFII